VVTRETTRKRRRQTVCPVCRAAIRSAPKPPPVAFLSHIRQARLASGEPEERPGGITREEYEEEMEVNIIKR
jgi:hypothetical protein